MTHTTPREHPQRCYRLHVDNIAASSYAQAQRTSIADDAQATSSRTAPAPSSPNRSKTWTRRRPAVTQPLPKQWRLMLTQPMRRLARCRIELLADDQLGATAANVDRRLRGHVAGAVRREVINHWQRRSRPCGREPARREGHELGAVARLSQGVGADDAHAGWRNVAMVSGQARRAVRHATAATVATGGCDCRGPQPIEPSRAGGRKPAPVRGDTDSNHVEAVRTQVNRGTVWRTRQDSLVGGVGRRGPMYRRVSAEAARAWQARPPSTGTR